MIPLHSLHGSVSLRQHDHWQLAYTAAAKQGTPQRTPQRTTTLILNSSS